MYPQYMCILLYVKVIWCNSIPYMYGQLEWGYMHAQYMCILLYRKHIWCNGIPHIYGQLECGVCVPSVYGHSAICETYVVSWYSRDLLSIGVGDRYILSICAFWYMWNLLGVMVFHTSIVNWSGGRYILSISAFCYMWNVLRVKVFHRSVVNWSGQ